MTLSLTIMEMRSYVRAKVAVEAPDSSDETLEKMGISAARVDQVMENTRRSVDLKRSRARVTADSSR